MIGLAFTGFQPVNGRRFDDCCRLIRFVSILRVDLHILLRRRRRWRPIGRSFQPPLTAPFSPFVFEASSGAESNPNSLP